MDNLILHHQPKAEPKTAKDMIRLARSHAYHDACRVRKTYMIAGGLSILGTPFVAATTALFSKNPETVSAAITIFNLGVSFSLLRAIEELRGKISFLCESFNLSAGGFNERDTKLTSSFKKALFAPAPTTLDYTTKFKQYPFSTFTAFVGALLTLATQSPALGAVSLSLFMMTVTAEECGLLEEIDRKATRAKQYIEACDKFGLR